MATNGIYVTDNKSKYIFVMENFAYHFNFAELDVMGSSSFNL